MSNSQLKNVNLKLKNYSPIPSAIYRNSNDANLILYYKSKTLKHKIDKIISNIQTRKRNLLQYNISCGLFDNRDSISSFPSISLSPTSRQYFHLDGRELETFSINKDKTNEILLNSSRFNNSKRTTFNYYGISNTPKRSFSLCDCHKTFRTPNYSHLQIKKLNNLYIDWKNIKIKCPESKIFQIIKDISNKEIKIKKNNNRSITPINFNLFKNTYLRNKVLDN